MVARGDGSGGWVAVLLVDVRAKGVGGGRDTLLMVARDEGDGSGGGEHCAVCPHAG